MISKFNNKNNNPHKKIAFTLAEMLITIAIVGILAAITIPNLYHSYRGAVIKAQLKKVDSDIHKLEQKMRADGLFPPSGTNTLRKILPNYLETAAACGSPKLSTYRSLYTSTLGYPNNILLTEFTALMDVS